MSIVITGASGKLGSQVIRSLLELGVPPSSIVASVRDPSKLASDLTSKGVQARQGDFNKPESLESAFAGAAKLLIISVDSNGPESIVAHKAAIDAAVASKVGVVYYTSLDGLKAHAHFEAANKHLKTEEYLQSSGLKHVNILAGARKTGQIVTPPYDGPMSWTARDDFALGTAKLMAADEVETKKQVEQRIYHFNSGVALDSSQVAKVLSRVWGISVGHVEQSEEEYRAGLLAAGLPGFLVDMMVDIARDSAEGDFAVVDSTLERLIGRKPTTVEEFFGKAEKA